jgi:drug/metabolite transporter (DMT)-like permease
MFYLIISILLSTAIIVTFKVFDRFKINIVQAITVNYLVASGFGYLSEAGNFSPADVSEQSWFYLAILTGLSLIVAFNLFAVSAQIAGVAITAISSRMSVIIPVLMGFVFFGDSAGAVKIAGIITGLLAFYFTSKKDKKPIVDKSLLFLPLMLFFAVGINDSLMKIAEHDYISDDFIPFLATAFGFALIFGLMVFGYKWQKENQNLELKNLIAGIILGLLNWYSTLFVLIGLSYFQVSVFMPVYNIGVVALAAITGMVIFGEKLSKINILGIFLALISILLIAGNFNLADLS